MYSKNKLGKSSSVQPKMESDTTKSRPMGLVKSKPAAKMGPSKKIKMSSGAEVSGRSFKSSSTGLVKSKSTDKMGPSKKIKMSSGAEVSGRSFKAGKK